MTSDVDPPCSIESPLSSATTILRAGALPDRACAGAFRFAGDLRGATVRAAVFFAAGAFFFTLGLLVFFAAIAQCTVGLSPGAPTSSSPVPSRRLRRSSSAILPSN